MEEPIKDTEQFRDRISTVDASGHRKWVYPKKPKGKFTNYRNIFSWILLVILFVAPFIKIGGNQFMLFDIPNRHFVVFGAVFTPQDMHLFAIAMITLMLFIVLFTVVFGRFFCGWMCPQTIFMEMVYRKIEYLIEGDRNQQIKLNNASWTNVKIFKKTIKHLIFIFLAGLFITIISLYIVSKDLAIQYFNEGFSEHSSYFMTLIIISALFYGVFAFFREQVCTNVCPYGRMQGVLLVPDSIVVHYDFKRGEPRGKISQKTNEQGEKLGDCIDCKMCVIVCPTGIDIRNGTQLECINCTACMDACDEIMIKTKRPLGLIRYDSYTGITEGRSKIMTPRTWAYSGVLAILFVIMGTMLTLRTDVETLLLKVPGSLFQESEDGYLTNMYKYEVINKTNKPIKQITFKLVDTKGEIIIVGGSAPTAEKLEISKGTLFIKINGDDISTRKTKLIIDVFSENIKIDQAKTTFLGPFRY